jgi:hypothetical protein
VSALDLSPLGSFEGFMAYSGRDEARAFARQLRTLERAAAEWMRAQGVETPEAIDADRLSDREARRLAEYLRILPRARAVRAAQLRLECEGYYEGIEGEYATGAMDWPTHEALAEFERRHRIYGWGFLGRETLEMLRRTPMEGEQEAVVRVLTERAMHAAGVLEDGSVDSHYEGADGEQHEVPNLEGELRAIVVEAFGLQHARVHAGVPREPGRAARGRSAPRGRPRARAARVLRRDMDLSVEIDRGDVWYEFPYDEHGNERAQPGRAPAARTHRLATWERPAHRLARFGTTIGGWRSEQIEGRLWWRYKNSPPGPVVWHQIVASPVWLPPESTPPRDLLRRTGRRGRRCVRARTTTRPARATRPPTASWPRTTSAYIERRRRNDSASAATRASAAHGSVDYMSIMRRHSHGCHRLHNHIAVRLMSFVLAHRPHTRVGQQAVAFRRDVEIDGNNYAMEINQGGYVYQLAEPIHVEVLEGRIRGDLARPIEEPLPRFDTTVGAYMLPDGGAVAISRSGQMTPVAVPSDAGVPAVPTATAP